MAGRRIGQLGAAALLSAAILLLYVAAAVLLAANGLSRAEALIALATVVSAAATVFLVFQTTRAANRAADSEILGELTVLDVETPRVQGEPDGRSKVKMTLHNSTDRPALQVSVQMHGTGGSGEPLTGEARTGGPVVHPSMTPGRGAILDVYFPSEPVALTIEVAHRGLRGGRVRQLYDWQSDPNYEWRLTAVIPTIS